MFIGDAAARLLSYIGCTFWTFKDEYGWTGEAIVVRFCTGNLGLVIQWVDESGDIVGALGDHIVAIVQFFDQRFAIETSVVQEFEPDSGHVNFGNLHKCVRVSSISVGSVSVHLMFVLTHLIVPRDVEGPIQLDRVVYDGGVYPHR